VAEVRTEDREQRTEDGRQKTEDRGRRVDKGKYRIWIHTLLHKESLGLTGVSNKEF